MTTMALPKKTFRISALLLVVCMISTVMLSGTFAKYTSTYAGQDTALVAKWSLTMTDGALNAFTDNSTATDNLDLFSHAITNNMVEGAGGTPGTLGDTSIIAPGISDEFVLKLTNNSDVAANIIFAITDDGADVPMEFSLDNFDTTLNGITELQDALNAAAYKLEAKTEADTDDYKMITVDWRWAFEDGTTDEAIEERDDADTVLGKAAAGAGPTTYKLNIDITATQVMPANFTMEAVDGIAFGVGATLSAGDLSSGNASYQWQVFDTLTGTYKDISPASEPTADDPNYTIGNYQGKYIRVVATGTGSNIGTVTSAPVGPVVPGI